MSYPSAALRELLVLHDSGVWGPEDAEDGISVLRSTNFRPDGSIRFENLTYRKVEPRKRAGKTLEPNDIILEKSGGGPKQPVGRVCLFRGHHIAHTFGNFTARLRVERAFAEPEYLFWYLRHLHLSGGTLRYQKHTSGIRNLETRRYLSQPVPLPSLHEQRQIVGILNRAVKIERLRARAAERLWEFVPALFVKMFGDPIDNPMRWRRDNLAAVVEEFRYGTSGKCTTDQQDGDLPVLRIPNVLDGVVNWGGLKFREFEHREAETLRLRVGDILFVRTNGNPNYIGRCAVYDGSRPAAFASYLIRARLIADRVRPRYLADALALPSMRQSLLRLARTTAGNYNISIRSLASLAVPLPPLDLQARYEHLVDKARALSVESEVAATKATTLSSSLMAKLLSPHAH